MFGEGGEDPRRHSAPVRSPVEREIHPGIRVPLAGAGRKIGRVHEDPVESPRAPGKVGPHRIDPESERAGAVPRGPHGVRVEVGRHDAGSPACRLDGDLARPASDLEDERPRANASERAKEERVLAGRIDGRPAPLGTGRAPP